MCGIIGIYGTNEVVQDIYDGMISLQHRGQDAAGMATYDDKHFYIHKNSGLVHEVFKQKNVEQQKGHIGLGHTRYPTAGSVSSSHKAQPFFVNAPYGICMIHNGNVYNYDELKNLIYEEQLRYLNTDSDSEALLNVFANSLQRKQSLEPKPDDIFRAAKFVMKSAQGSYSIISIIANGGMLAFRDPHGIRPLVFGKRKDENGNPEYIFASEDATLNILGFEVIRDVKPGEAIYIDNKRQVHTEVLMKKKHVPCIFEYVYFARPDSTIDNINVYKSRLKMGEKLYDKIKKLNIDDIDVVIPVPDTSRTAAVQLAYILNRKYREGFVKNRYIPRTFIMQGQSLRQKSVRQKLNAINLEFKNKNVLLVDDSIVRGTTCQQIIQMARDAGAKKVYFASAAPPVRYPNVYGIDMPSVQELLAHNRTTEEIAQLIGADWLIYQDLEDLIACTRNKNIKQFDTSCFTGHYVTRDIDQNYLDQLEKHRNNAEKMKRQGCDTELLDLNHAV